MKFTSLDQRTLDAWQAQEQEFANSVQKADRFGDRFLSAKAMLKTLFPEIKSEGNHANFLFNSSITTQIPFSTHLVVDLRPYETEQAFTQHYGISVEDFVRLQRDGYLIPNFGSDIFRYGGKDHLLPIFQASQSHPSNTRTDQVFSLIEPEYIEIIAKLRRDLGSDLEARWKAADATLRDYYMNDPNAFELTWTKRIARVYAVSPTIGEILIRSSKEPDLLALTNLFTSVLVFPLTKSVGGIYKTSFTNYEALCESVVGAKVEDNKVLPYDADIAEQLCNSLDLALPAGIDVKSLAKYLEDDLVIQANKLMQEINGEVESQGTGAQSKAQTLREVWKEMAAMISKNEARRGRLKEGFRVGIAALVGTSLWAKLNLASVLVAVAAREAFKTQIDAIAGTAADKVNDLVANRIQPDHTLMFSEWIESSKKVAGKVHLS